MESKNRTPGGLRRTWIRLLMILVVIAGVQGLRHAPRPLTFGSVIESAAASFAENVLFVLILILFIPPLRLVFYRTPQDPTPPS